MNSTELKLKVTDIKRIRTPYDGTHEENEEGYTTTGRTYVASIQLRDIPSELNNWRKVNVRDSKMTSGVAKSIANSLREDPQAFFFKNRGLTIVANDIIFSKDKSDIRLVFDNPDYSGLLDGGHTYTAIRSYLEDLDYKKLSSLDGHVKLEIIVGLVSHADIEAVVEARNTSIQVRLESLEELAGHFDPIKNVLKKQTYADEVAYKEFELADDGSRKTIDIKDILSYLICFDTERYPSNSKNQPVIAYSSKAAVVKQYSDKVYRQQLEKYITLLPDILELRDLIYAELPEAYNKLAGGAFGRLNGITGSESKSPSRKLPFSGHESSYQIPAPFIYPVLAAFRSLVKIENNKASWIVDPRDVWQSQKGNLSMSIRNVATKIENPNKMGKEASLWETCYRDLLLAQLSGEL